MRFPVTMLTSTLSMTLTMALGTSVHAQIYESKNAEGNPVYTDTPSPGAEDVVLSQENIADAVEVPSEALPATAGNQETAASVKPGHEHGNVYVIPDERNERVSREAVADRPHEVLEAETPYEVGDNPGAAELERRKQAREGEYIDGEGNTVRFEHRGSEH